VLSSFVDTLETCHAFKIKITRTPPKYATSTLKVRNNIFSFIHPIIPISPNYAPSSCFYLSKVLLQKEACGYAKVTLKTEKREKESIEKWTSVRDIKTMGTLIPA
jgi:hypothetical protein